MTDIKDIKPNIINLYIEKISNIKILDVEALVNKYDIYIDYDIIIKI